GAANLHGQSCHETYRTGGVDALFAGLLGVAENDILYRCWINSCPFDERFDTLDGQIIAPHVAEPALFLVRPANRRPHAINYHGGLHLCASLGIELAATRRHLFEQWSWLKARAERLQRLDHLQ